MVSLPPRLTRPAVAYVHDLVMAAASFVISLYLRVGDDIVHYPLEFLALSTVLFTMIAGLVFWQLDVHRGVWRYASLNDLLAIARATTFILLLFFAAMFIATRFEPSLDALPRSLVVINWFVLMILLAAPRILYRRLKDGRLVLTYDRADKRVPVLLVGAGDNAEMFIQMTENRRDAQYRVVGIIDDSPTRLGRFIGGIEVMGGIDDLAATLNRLKLRGKRPQRVVVAKETIPGPDLRRLVDAADQLGLSVARLPRLTEFRAADAASRVEVRPIAIEDLLGRPQTVLDRNAMKTLVAGRRVLVTGAGGTIGAELVRQIADLEPARLILLDNSEFNLYSIDLELGERKPTLDRLAVLADVRDAGRFGSIMTRERPAIVFHAAALKHVPMVEAHPCEGVLTNVLGTRIVADACRTYGVEAMVLISTDKAVNPSNVMGASKRLAESWCQALDHERAKGGTTRFVTVRFGNVLGSTGSVVPLFQRQLAAGGPLTVTHPDISRYFMTVREAVELVLQASALGEKSSTTSDDHGGGIYVLDMGEPVKIADLARRMIRLAGLQPNRDMQIVFTGLRPGEKLNEELFHSAEPLQPTEMSGILLARPRVVDRAFLAKALDELAALARAGDSVGTVALLRRLVPEFRGGEVTAEASRTSLAN